MYHFLKADNKRFSRRFITIVTVAESRHYRCKRSQVQTADLLWARYVFKLKWNDLELEERRKKKMPEDAKVFLYFEKTRLKYCPSLMTKSSPRSWHRGRHV